MSGGSRHGKRILKGNAKESGQGIIEIQGKRKRKDNSRQDKTRQEVNK